MAKLDWNKCRKRAILENDAGKPNKFKKTIAAATERQLKYIQDLGIEAPRGLTKSQASHLIQIEIHRDEIIAKTIRYPTRKR